MKLTVGLWSKDTSVSFDELFHGDSDSEALLPDPDCLKHSSTSELLADIVGIELIGTEIGVGFDAPDVARTALLNGGDQFLELKPKLVANGVASQTPGAAVPQIELAHQVFLLLLLLNFLIGCKQLAY